MIFFLYKSRWGSWHSRIAALSLGLCCCLAQADIPRLPGDNRLSLKAQLGKQLFFDDKLSSPPGQSCASCHDPKAFFVDPDKDSPTSVGALPELKGSRNTPTLLYAAYSNAFHYDKKDGLFIGGFFLDGRAETLSKQAKGPFLNPLEMANPDLFSVVDQVRTSDYAPLFTRVYGRNAFADYRKTFNYIADAIATFERSAVFRPFTSKYDYYLTGRATLTSQEMRGRRLFENPKKGNCAACHPSRPARDGTPPLFTDFSYDNLGVPRNVDNPVYQLADKFNPVGWDFVDNGLGGSLGDAAENGKFKVPSLRNIAKTAPYMHNGYFKTLRGVLAFYSTRDALPVCNNQWAREAAAIKSHCWPAPEVKKNVNVDELGELILSESEIDDILAFLQTLTDGFQPQP
ncbi:MAG: c-type cytochrome [Methylococcales bacterium]|nr:c-type cytochrome [Methylococcales bacterium]